MTGLARIGAAVAASVAVLLAPLTGAAMAGQPAPRPTAREVRAINDAYHRAVAAKDAAAIGALYAVVDPQRLGAAAGRLSAREMRAVDDALARVLGL